MLLKGQRDLLEKLKKDEVLAANPSMQQGFSDLDLLFTYLEDFGALHTVSFDLSLARGECALPSNLFSSEARSPCVALPANTRADARRNQAWTTILE